MGVKLSQPVPGVAVIEFTSPYKGRDKRNLCQGWHEMAAGLTGVCLDVRALNDWDLCKVAAGTCGLSAAPSLHRVAMLGDGDRLQRVLTIERVGFKSQVMRRFASDGWQEAVRYAQGEEDPRAK